MPWKPQHICSYNGCQELTHDRYCGKHKKEMTKRQNDRSSKIYTYKWRKSSKEFLKKHPLCVYCMRDGRLTSATEVDHIKPHGGNLKLFWNKINWQPLCKSCHSKKTAEEDGGFGNTLVNTRGRGSASLWNPCNDNVPGPCVRNRRNRKGGITWIQVAVTIRENYPWNAYNYKVIALGSMVDVN